MRADNTKRVHAKPGQKGQIPLRMCVAERITRCGVIVRTYLRKIIMILIKAERFSRRYQSCSARPFFFFFLSTRRRRIVVVLHAGVRSQPTTTILLLLQLLSSSTVRRRRSIGVKKKK